MTIEIKCEQCGKLLGEIYSGKYRRTTVAYCVKCAERIKITSEIAQQAATGSCDVVDDLFAILGNKNPFK